MSSYNLFKSVQLDDDFEGFDDEMLFKFSDGTFWIQDEYKYWYHYAYRPKAKLLEANGRKYLQIDGKEQVVAIRQISDVIESQINGEFNGWEGETEYQLTNGQIWKQCVYQYEYVYAYMPEVIVYEANGAYKMRVEGTTADVKLFKKT